MQARSHSSPTRAAPPRPVLKVVPQQRMAPVLPEAHRPPLRVLQNGRAPAQLSLFLRPSAPKR